MRAMIRNLLIAAPLTLAACESPEERKAREAAAARARVSAESTVAHSAAGERVAAGAWTPALVTKRLVDAGLAPQRDSAARSQPWMGAPEHSLMLGVAKVHAYVFADSVARMSAAAKLDPVTLAPAGMESPWPKPHELVQNGNMLAIVTGGTDRQRDRIVTALAAGIGAP